MFDKRNAAVEGRELVTLCIFLDFSKAFDRVGHHIVLSKLNHYGIRGPVLLKPYLSDRKQFVHHNDSKSSPLPISYGVLQGFILGPMLFFYTNDVVNSSSTLNFIYR